MDVLQEELIPALNRVKKAGAIHPRLREWMNVWQGSHDAGFLVGVSRKRTLGRILEDAGHPAPPADRDAATGATTALAVAAGAAVIRVHDVRSALQVARTSDAIVRTAGPERGRTLWPD